MKRSIIDTLAAIGLLVAIFGVTIFLFNLIMAIMNYGFSIGRIIFGVILLVILLVMLTLPIMLLVIIVGGDKDE